MVSGRIWDKRELFQALDALYAYEIGATDSGIHDDSLKADVREWLQRYPADQMLAGLLAEFVREAFLTDDALKLGYGLMDAHKFIGWLEDQFGIDI